MLLCDVFAHVFGGRGRARAGSKEKDGVIVIHTYTQRKELDKSQAGVSRRERWC